MAEFGLAVVPILSLFGVDLTPHVSLREREREGERERETETETETERERERHILTISN